MGKNTSNTFFPEIGERAVRMVQEHRNAYPSSQWTAIGSKINSHTGQVQVRWRF